MVEHWPEIHKDLYSIVRMVVRMGMGGEFWESEFMDKQLNGSLFCTWQCIQHKAVRSRQRHGQSVWEQTSEPNLPTDEFPIWNASAWLPSAPDLEGTDFSVTVPPLAQNRNSCHSPRCHFTCGILEVVLSPLQSAKTVCRDSPIIPGWQRWQCVLIPAFSESLAMLLSHTSMRSPPQVSFSHSEMGLRSYILKEMSRSTEFEIEYGNHKISDLVGAASCCMQL